MKRFIASVLFSMMSASGLLFAGMMTSLPDPSSERRFFPSFRKIGSGLRANLCRILAPIHIRLWQAPMVTVSQVVALEKYLEPGDIILTRDNLKLSAVFIPGFWTHAALYLGRPKQIRNYFFDRTLSDLLGIDAQDGKNDSVKIPDPLLNAALIMEAVPKGVGKYPLCHLSPADYIAVLRPLISKTAKKKALEKALAFDGKAYDFYFDFNSSDALICSELVYRAYCPENGREGLSFELYLRSGKPFMSANDIAKKFSMDYGTEGRQLDCILFIDGNHVHRSAAAVAEAFCDSWTR